MTNNEDVTLELKCALAEAFDALQKARDLVMQKPTINHE